MIQVETWPDETTQFQNQSDILDLRSKLCNFSSLTLIMVVDHYATKLMITSVQTNYLHLLNGSK